MKTTRWLGLLCVMVSLLIWGCPQKRPPTQTDVETPPRGGKGTTQHYREIGAALPATVFVYGGVGSYAGFSKKLDMLSKRFGKHWVGLEEFKDEFDANMSTLFKNMDWLDKSKSVKFIVTGVPFGVKEEKEPASKPSGAEDVPDARDKPGGALVVPITSQDKLMAALQAKDVQKNVAGNALVFKAKEDKVFVNFMDNNAVFTEAASTFAKLKPLLQTVLPKYVVTSESESVVMVGNITARYQKEIEGARAMALKYLEEEEEIAQLGAGLKEFLVAKANGLFDFVMDIEAVALSFDATPSNGMVRLRIMPKKNSSLEKWIQTLPGRKSSLANRLPVQTYAAMLFSLKAGVFGDWIAMGVDLLAQELRFTPEEKKKFKSAVTRWLALQTGEYHMAVHGQGKAPVALTTITGSSDGVKARHYRDIVLDLLIAKGFARYKEEIKEDILTLPDMDAKSIRALIQLGVKMAEQSVPGLSMDLGSKPHGEGTLDYLTVTVDPEKLKLGATEKEIMKYLGNSGSVVLGYGRDATVFCLGTQAVEQTKAVIDGKESFNANPAWTTTRKVLAPNTVFALFLSPSEFLKAFDKMPFMAPVKEMIGKLPDEAYSLSVGGSDAVEIVWDIPLASTVALLKLSDLFDPGEPKEKLDEKALDKKEAPSTKEAPGKGAVPDK